VTVRNHAPPSIPGPRYFAIGCGALLLVGLALAAVYDQTFNVVHFEFHNTSNESLWFVVVEQNGDSLARRQIRNGGSTWSTTLRPADEAAIVLRFDPPDGETETVVVDGYPSVSSTALLRVEYDGTSVTDERIVGWKGWF
jgi:hypothetical protein